MSKKIFFDTEARDKVKRGVDTLAHFAAWHGKDDTPVRGDLDPAIERDVRFARQHHLAAAEPRPLREHTPAHDQRTGARQPQQPRAPLHALTPAARLMATRMRW